MNNDISIGRVENGWIIRQSKLVAPNRYDTWVARSDEEMLEIVKKMANQICIAQLKEST